MLQKPISADTYSIGDMEPCWSETDNAHVATFDISDADADKQPQWEVIEELQHRMMQIEYAMYNTHAHTPHREIDDDWWCEYGCEDQGTTTDHALNWLGEGRKETGS